MNEIITFSKAGQKKIASLLNENNETAFVRIFIKSGGCSGYSYGVKIDDQKLPGDKEFVEQTAKVVIDERSWPLIKGSEIDYTESLMGGGFNIINPNAKASCGCGSSFRVDEKKCS